MARFLDSKTAASIRNQIHGALFGHPRAAGHHGGSIDDLRALSQEISLAAPAGGGGAILAIQALGHQTRPSRLSLRD